MNERKIHLVQPDETQDDIPGLIMYTIYWNHYTHPGTWLVWRWVRDRPGGVRLPGDEGPTVADTLGEARSVIPPGLTRKPRHELEDSSIYEVWL